MENWLTAPQFLFKDKQTLLHAAQKPNFSGESFQFSKLYCTFVHLYNEVLTVPHISSTENTMSFVLGKAKNLYT